MFRAILFIVLLSVSLIHAGVFKARESEEPESFSMTDQPCQPGTACRSSSFNHLRANKNSLSQTRNIFG
jgi:hypothetical protein